MHTINFEQVFQGLPDSQILLDNDYTIVMATRAYLKVTGRKAEELLGTYIFAPFPENDAQQEMVQAKILKALDTLRDTGVPFSLEPLRYDLADPETGNYVTRYWAISGSAIFTTDEAKPMILYRAMDMTAEMMAKRDMEDRFRSVEVFKLLVDSVRDYAIFMLDPDGTVRTWNKGAKRLKQYEDYEIIGKKFSVFYLEEDIRRGKPAHELEQALRTGTYEEEFWRLRKDGSRFWANVIITAVWNERKEHVGFAKVTRDLTEKKKAEQTIIDAYEDASRLKSEFLANMSHEIRTPMNGVLSAATLLTDTGRLESDQAELLGIITESGKSLLKIINDILDYSKIDAHELKLMLGPVDLKKVLQDIIKLYQVTIPDKPVEIEFLCHARTEYVVGDELRLHQVMLNLVDNAVKFTEKGRVEISLDIEDMDVNSNGVLVRLQVSDTGIGMSEESIAKLFKPFSQGDLSSRKRFKGTGLGLSICKQLVDLMGGTISVRSELGKGSVFLVCLKLTKVISNKPVVPEPTPVMPDREPGVYAKHAKILVAEDNAINQKVILRILRKLGYENVELAKDGQECVEKFNAGRYALILMDVQMPRMDGIEATKLIRSGGSRVPILAMTANALKGDDQVCLAAGMDDYLSKPIDVRSLAGKLAHALAYLDAEKETVNGLITF